jgi:hypothetical protein
VELHESIVNKALESVGISKPEKLGEFYRAMLQYERAINSKAQTRDWLQEARKAWLAEMLNDRCDVAHAATLLIALEIGILPSAQRSSWLTERNTWIGGLVAIGGKPPTLWGLNLLWECLLAFHRSVMPSVRGASCTTAIQQKPTTLPEFYNLLYKYECGISSTCQSSAWGSTRRDAWIAEMKSERCDIAHAATMLLEVERNVDSDAQTSEWRTSERSSWCKILISIGGKGL